MALTVKRVEKLMSRGERGRFCDGKGDGKGLYLVVATKTAAHWERRYQLNGKVRHMGLGSAKTFSLDEARKRNHEFSKQLADGVDPLMVRRAKRAEAKAAAGAPQPVTFKQAADRYIADNAASWKSLSHGKQWIDSLERFVHPIIGARDVASIQTPDVLAVLEQHVEGNSRKNVAGKFWEARHVSADRTRSRIELVLNYAMARGHRPQGVNPASLALIRHVLRKPQQAATVASYAALPYRQVPQLIVTLRGREGVAAQALQFLILTAARAGEVIGARWDEIDLSNKTWTVPAARMKAGRQHIVPLSAFAMTLLESLYREEGNPHLFVGLHRPSLSAGAMATILKRTGHTDVTVHGFRAAFSTWAAERTDFEREIAELALAHTVGTSVERRYKRTTLFDRRRSLMEAWSYFITSPQPKAGEVVPLRGAR
jgi:integrase